MSGIEPRLNPSQVGGRAASGAPNYPPKAGNGNGSGAKNGSGSGTVTATISVGASVENALALVQQQLAREAATVRVAPFLLAPPAPAPAPPAPAPVERPAPPTRVVVPVAAPLLVTEMYEDDAEFWGEPVPRRQRERIDPARLTRQDKRGLGKLRARKVRRIVRHVSPWSVFKVSILFYLCLWLIFMVAGVILWKAGSEAGAVANAEKFYAKAVGDKIFELDGRKIFRAMASVGGIFVFASTGFTVLMSILFNLITDLTGGVRISVLELETVRRDIRHGSAGDRLRAQKHADDTDDDSGDDETTDHEATADE